MAVCTTDTHVVMTNNKHPSKIPYGVLRNRCDDKVETLRKTYRLKVEVMWECEWKRVKLNNPVAVAFMGRYTHLKQLMARERSLAAGQMHRSCTTKLKRVRKSGI